MPPQTDQADRNASCDDWGKPSGTDQAAPPRGGSYLKHPALYTLLRCVMGAVPEADYSIRLWAFLALDDIELDLVAFLERFVPVQLNCGIVNEYIRPVFASDESVALGVVEPLNLSLVLSHRFLPSFGVLQSLGD
jgi:hypothetical protein